MKEGKYNKVACQKGPIVADQKTMKHMPLAQVQRESEAQNRQLRDMQTPTLMMPKQ